MVRERRRPGRQSNDGAIAAEMRRTMSAVGIGRRYYDARLHEFPQGVELRDLLVRTWTAENIMAGVGITIAGGGENAGHLHMMLARSLHLAGAEVRVMGLQALARELQRDDEFGETPIERVGALFVRRFEAAGRCPLRQYEIAMVEELIDTRSNSSLPTFPWFAGVAAEDWWSADTVEQLGRNRLFEVTA